MHDHRALNKLASWAVNQAQSVVTPWNYGFVNPAPMGNVPLTGVPQVSGNPQAASMTEASGAQASGTSSAGTQSSFMHTYMPYWNQTLTSFNRFVPKDQRSMKPVPQPTGKVNQPRPRQDKALIDVGKNWDKEPKAADFRR